MAFFSKPEDKRVRERFKPQPTLYSLQQLADEMGYTAAALRVQRRKGRIPAGQKVGKVVVYTHYEYQLAKRFLEKWPFIKKYENAQKQIQVWEEKRRSHLIELQEALADGAEDIDPLRDLNL
jgi:hypothetical protein